MELWLRRKLWLCCLQAGRALLLCLGPAQDLDLHCVPESLHAHQQGVNDNETSDGLELPG